MFCLRCRTHTVVLFLGNLGFSWFILDTGRLWNLTCCAFTCCACTSRGLASTRTQCPRIYLQPFVCWLRKCTALKRGTKRRGFKSNPFPASQISTSSSSEPTFIDQRSAYDASRSHSLSLSTEINTRNMSKASTKIQMDRFTNPESLRQLEVIDALRELGLGHDISLPQVSSLQSHNGTKPRFSSADLLNSVARGCWRPELRQELSARGTYWPTVSSGEWSLHPIHHPSHLSTHPFEAKVDRCIHSPCSGCR